METGPQNKKHLLPSEVAYDSLHAQIVDLASGEIRGIRAWWLRLQIARNPELRQEWEATQNIWDDLKILREAEPGKRPAWPVSAIRSKPTVTFGGLTMNRGAFLVSYATLIIVATGMIALRSSLVKKVPPSIVPDTTASQSISGEILVLDESGDSWPPDTREAKDREGGQAGTIVYDGVDPQGKTLHWTLDGPFTGETRLLDAEGKLLRTTLHSDGVRYGYGTARVWITLNKHKFLIKGAPGNYNKQKFTFKLRSGAIIGYVELIPQSPPANQDYSWHLLNQGIEEVFEGSNGAQDGTGQASGVFQPRISNRDLTGSPRATWKLTGVGEVRFRRSNHKVLRRGFASPGEETVKSEPVLEWNSAGKSQTFKGYGTFPVELPDGEKLTAEVVPWEKRWTPPATK